MARDRAVVAAQRPLVEVRAGDLELVADLGRLFEHLLAGERVAQAVLDHRVERLDVAHPEALARAGEQVRRLRHRLHPAADRDLEVARADGLIDHPDRAHARRADLVDRLGGDLDRDAGVDLRLAARDLPLPRLQHRSHHDVLDLLGRDIGALERLADRHTAQMRGRERRQAPAQLADRRAGAAQDHGSRHAPSRLTSARMDVATTTDAPPATNADTIVVGVFEDEGIAHDHGGVLQALVDSGEAKRGLRKLARDARRGAALHRRRARRAQRLRPRAGAGRGRGGRRPGARRSWARRCCAGRSRTT